MWYTEKERKIRKRLQDMNGQVQVFIYLFRIHQVKERLEHE